MCKLHLLPKCHSVPKVAYKAVPDRLAPLAEFSWLLCLSPLGLDCHLISGKTFEFSLHKGRWMAPPCFIVSCDRIFYSHLLSLNLV